MANDTKSDKPSKLEKALKVTGVVAVAAGVVLIIWLGPSMLGGALAAAGAKIAYTGAKIAGKNIIGRK